MNKDIYTYTDAPEVLINNFNIKNEDKLDKIEKTLVSLNISNIKNYPDGIYNITHLKKIHRYLFKEIYPWAGEIRGISIRKNDSIFCKPQLIIRSYNSLYKKIRKDKFLKNIKAEHLYKSLAYYHGKLSIIHPFREGNGRTIRAFLYIMVKKNHNIELNYNSVSKKQINNASIDAQNNNYSSMEELYQHILSKSKIR